MLTIEQVTIDAADPKRLGHWWREVLGWSIIFEDEFEVELRAAVDILPGLLFVANAEVKATKNRLHLDLRPDDQDAEVERLVALGAQRVDIGQGSPSWVVLSDPEGNEFCVLRQESTPAGA